MTYPYKSRFRLGAVGLNVRNLQVMKNFYQHILGLSILEETEQSTTLGIFGEPSTPLVKLYLAELDDQPSYGLYHFAILLPTRRELGNLLQHLLQIRIPLQGGADHGYSEALYFADPEGNGIEVYWDKPIAQWDIRDNGDIIGITEEIDGQGLVELAQVTDKPYKMPLGTTMGHFHLSVRDSKKATDQYVQALQIRGKMIIPTGAWMADGDYHHHLAVNEWAGPNLAKRSPNSKGLAFLELVFENTGDLESVQKAAGQIGWQIINATSQQVIVRDRDGIEIRATLEQ